MAACNPPASRISRGVVFLRNCGRLMMVPVLCLVSVPAYAQTWLGVQDNGTPGEFNWTEPLNWNAPVPNGPGASATFGAVGGNINIDAPITLGTLTFNTGATFNLLAGANQLTFDQVGTGLIDIDSGTVSIGTDLALTTGGLDIDVAPAPVVLAEITGIIGGDGPVTKLGTGTLILSGMNTYTQTTNINVGTLQLGAAGAIPDGSAVSVAGGAIFDLNDFSETIGSLSGAGSVDLGTGTLTTGGNNDTTTFSGVISGAGDLVKEGSGTFTLSGVNTYSGGTTFAAGTLAVSSDNNLGAASGGLTFVGGTLQTTAGISSSRTLTFNAGGGTIDTDTMANISTFSGDLTGTGDLTKEGAGTLVLSGVVANYDGNIAINDGVLEIFEDDVDQLTSDLTGTGEFRKTGTGILFLSGNNNAHLGDTVVAAGRLTSLAPGIIGDLSDVTVSAGATLDLNNNDERIGSLSGGGLVVLNGAMLTTTNDLLVNDSTFSGTISGNMDSIVVKEGDGFLELSGSNTFEGTLQITEGFVTLGADDVFADRMALDIATDAELWLHDSGNPAVGFSDTIGPLSGNGDIQLGTSGTNTLTVNSEDANGLPADSTFTGRILGSGGFTKTGGGTFTIGGANTYTGTTTINAGILRLAADDRISDLSAVVVDDTLATGATLDLNNFNEQIASLSGNGFVTLGSGTLVTGDAGNSNFMGVISGTGGLTKVGTGTFTLSGMNTYTGDTTVSGGTLQLGTTGAISDASAVTVDAGATFDLNDFSETIGSLAGAGTVDLGTATLTTGGDNSDTLFSGSITGTGSLVKEGSGTFTLSGASSYSGMTMINGGVLQLGTNNALPTGTALTVAGGATFDVNSFSPTIGSLSGSGFVTLGNGTLTTGDATDTEFSGVISGTGSLTKEGTGTFTLSGTNTYSGGTSINNGILLISSDASLGATGPGIGMLTFNGAGGTLALGADVTTARDVILTADGTIDTNGFNATLSGLISGAGGLTKTGTGTLTLSGMNTYTGGTTIDDGIVSVSADNNLGDATGPLTFDGGTLQTTASIMSGRAVTLNAGGGTIDTNGFDSEFTGDFTGTGDLNKNGAGTLTLSGNGTYTGATNINGGILSLGNSGAVGNTSAVTLAAGTTFDLNGFDQTIGSLTGPAGSFVTLGSGTLTTGDATPLTEFAGVISGTGGLTKQGTGIFRLSGMNTYTGPTMVNAGTLQLGASDVLSDSTAVTVAGGATFDLNSNSDTIGSLAGSGNVTLGSGMLTAGADNTSTVFSGIISGTGSFTKVGTGTMVLSGLNTYSGGTSINGGVLSVGNDSNLGDPAGALSFDGGTLQTTAGITSARTVTLNAGGGTIDTNGFNSLFSGIISGPGALTKIGNGTLTLSGMNTYTGGTSINGGILSVGSDNNMGDPAGPLAFDGGTLLTTAGITSARAVTLNAGGGIIDTNGFDSLLSGMIGGTGGLTKTGAGTLTLSGSLTYSGDTTINVGVLEIDTAAGDRSLSGAINGPGTLVKSGNNTLTLSGSLNGFTGNTIISTGILEIDTTAGSTAYVGDISGSGSLTKSGANVLTLSGMNTYTGRTDINGGTLRLGASGTIPDVSAVTVAGGATFDLNGFDEVIGSLAGSGNVTLGVGTLTTGGNSASTEFSGVLSGTGGLIKEGTGTFTLSGVNTYTGGTTINGGTVSVSTNSNLGNTSGGLIFDGGTLLTTAGITSARAVTLNAGGGTIDTSGFNSLFSGIISGPGALTKTGAGTLTLSGVNTYTGGTSINGGVLSVSSDSNLGDPAGALAFDGGTLLTTAGITSARAVTLNAGGGTIDTNGFDSVLSGVISGPGGLTKNGAGTLSLTGANTYVGPTSVNAGRLDVDGSITSDTTVFSGATLGGNGTITGNVIVASGGTMAPGNSIGQTNVVGNYTQAAGSTFELELQAVAVPGTEVAGVDFDQTNVTGSAVIEPGATLNVISAPGTYQLGSRYRFLQTSGGLSGTFDMVTGTTTFNGGLLQGTVLYGANNAELVINQTNLSGLFTGSTRNRRAVAAALDTLALQVSGVPGSDAVNVLNQLLALPTAQQAMALDQIGGSSHGASRLVALQSSFDYLNAVRRRIRTSLVNQELRDKFSPVWVEGIAATGKIDRNQDATGVDYDSAGIIFGVDQGLAGGRQGISVGIIQADADNQNGLDTGDIQSYNITAYSSTISDPIYLLGILGYGRNEFDSTRQLTTLAPNRTAIGSTTGDQLMGLLETGIYVNSAAWQTQVYLSGQYVGLDQDGFAETGANSMNLNVNGSRTNSFRIAAGMRMASRRSQVFQPEARVGVIRELLDADTMVSAAFTGTNVSFIQYGLNLPKSLAHLGVGGTLNLNDSVSLFGGYDVLLSNQQISHALSASAIINY